MKYKIFHNLPGSSIHPPKLFMPFSSCSICLKRITYIYSWTWQVLFHVNIFILTIPSAWNILLAQHYAYVAPNSNMRSQQPLQISLFWLPYLNVSAHACNIYKNRRCSALFSLTMIYNFLLVFMLEWILQNFCQTYLLPSEPSSWSGLNIPAWY